MLLCFLRTCVNTLKTTAKKQPLHAGRAHTAYHSVRGLPPNNAPSRPRVRQSNRGENCPCFLGSGRSANSIQTPNTIDTNTQYKCRSEEHTSELQSLMRIPFAVFCLKNKKKIAITIHIYT